MEGLEALAIVFGIGAVLVIILENTCMNFENALYTVIFIMPMAYALIYVSWQILTAIV